MGCVRQSSHPPELDKAFLLASPTGKTSSRPLKDRPFLCLDTAEVLLNADSCLNLCQGEWGISTAYLFSSKSLLWKRPQHYYASQWITFGGLQAIKTLFLAQVWQKGAPKLNSLLDDSSHGCLAISRWALNCKVCRKCIWSFPFLEVNEQYSHSLASAHQAAWEGVKKYRMVFALFPPSLTPAFPLHWSNQTAVTFQSLSEWQN